MGLTLKNCTGIVQVLLLHTQTMVFKPSNGSFPLTFCYLPPHSIDHHKILPGILFLLYYFSFQYTYFTSRIKFRILGSAFDIFLDLDLRRDLFQLKWYTCHLWNKPCTFLSVDLCSWQLVAWNSCPSFSSFLFFLYQSSFLIFPTPQRLPWSPTFHLSFHFIATAVSIILFVWLL